MKTTLFVVTIALLLSLAGNVYQMKLRKDDKIAADLALANSNTTVAGKLGEIRVRDSLISTIRKERHYDSLKSSSSLVALKQSVATLQGKLKRYPKVIVYNPDTATVDSLRVAFALKDSVIDTQALMISTFEVDREAVFMSFHREIEQMNQRNAANVQISNDLQTQLVAEQGKVRKEVRKKKFFRFLAGVGIATAGVLAVMSQ